MHFTKILNTWRNVLWEAEQCIVRYRLVSKNGSLIAAFRKAHAEAEARTQGTSESLSSLQWVFFPFALRGGSAQFGHSNLLALCRSLGCSLEVFLSGASARLCGTWNSDLSPQ